MRDHISAMSGKIPKAREELDRMSFMKCEDIAYTSMLLLITDQIMQEMEICIS